MASPSMPSVRLMALLEPASTKNMKANMNHSGMHETSGYFMNGIQSSRIIVEYSGERESAAQAASVVAAWTASFIFPDTPLGFFLTIFR